MQIFVCLFIQQIDVCRQVQFMKVHVNVYKNLVRIGFTL